MAGLKHLHKYLLLLFLLLPWSTGISPPFLSIGGEAGLTCTYADGYATGGDTTFAVGYYENNERLGTIITTGAVTLCQVDIYFHNTAGNPALNDYYVEIYTITDSTDLDTRVGLSDKVDGASWSAEFVSFAFSTPVSLSAATPYGFAVLMDNDSNPNDANDIDTTNFVRMYHDNNDGAWDKGVYSWSAAGADLEDANDDFLMKYYTMQ